MRDKSILILVISSTIGIVSSSNATVVLEPIDGLLLTYDGGSWIDQNTVVLDVNEVLELSLELGAGHSSLGSSIDYILSNSAAELITGGGYGYGPVNFPCPFCFIENAQVYGPQHVNICVNNDFCGSVPGPCVIMQNLLVHSLEAKPVELNIIVNDIAIDSKFIGDIIIHTLQIVPMVLLTPNGGETLMADGTYTIRWDSVADINNILIEYSTNNGQNWTPVDPPNMGNTGSYMWDPVPIADSNQCLVRISDVNDPNVFDTSDELFTIFQCQGPIVGDLSGDCYVDFRDVSILVTNWLECGNRFDPACSF